MSRKYRILALEGGYHDTGTLCLQIQALGNSETFNKSVKELYQKDWLDAFSKEDMAQIAALYTAEQTQNFSLVEKFLLQNTLIKAITID